MKHSPSRHSCVLALAGAAVSLSSQHAVADETAAMAVTVASELRVTRSSKTLQRRIKLPWQRLRAAERQSHLRVARTEQAVKPAKTPVIAHQVSARKATGMHAVSAVSALAAAMTVVMSVVSEPMVRMPRPTR